MSISITWALALLMLANAQITVAGPVIGSFFGFGRGKMQQNAQKMQQKTTFYLASRNCGRISLFVMHAAGASLR